MQNKKGFSLTELLIVLSIFGIVMAGLYSAYSTQLKQGVKEFRFAESEMEYHIAKTIIERDIEEAGYGLTFPSEWKNYCGTDVSPASVPATTCPSKYNCSSLGFCVPVAVTATDDNPDTLTLMGTAIGNATRASQAWSYVTTTGQVLPWTDSRESLRSGSSNAEGDRILYVNPISGNYVTASAADATTSKTWLFPYSAATTSGTSSPPSTLQAGDITYGLYYRKTGDPEPTADYPYYIVRYYLAAPTTALKNCESSTQNLLRAESKSGSAVPTGGNPILSCVLDFEIAIGRDTNNDQIVDCWDNGGADLTANNADLKATIKDQVKQVRVYALVQDGNYDPVFTYSNPDPHASAPDKILVGDSILPKCVNNSASAGLVGREIPLSANQRHYNWKVITISAIPRNIR